MEPGKPRALIIIIFAIVSILFLSPSLFSQEEPSAEPGFGLQPTIFSSVRSLSSDYTKNFSILSDYQLTPGDEFTLYLNLGVQSDLYRSLISEYRVYLTRDYTLTVPFLGKISARNMSLQELQNHVVSQISSRMPVEYVSFILTDPAQFNVFVYGGVNLPGMIVANPLVRVIDALGMTKGFKPNASYRKVHLLRGDTTLVLDISRYYKAADFQSNPPLQPGDRIFVPTADVITTISGAVEYPGIYELLEGETLQDLLKLAGMFKPGANTQAVEIARLDETGKSFLLQVPYSQGEPFPLRNGDTVMVRYSSENREMVTLEGAVFGTRTSGNSPLVAPVEPRRLEIPYFPGISLLTVLDMTGGPTPYARTEESYLIKKGEEERLPLPVRELWDTRDLSLDRELSPGDYISIPIEKLTVFVTGMVVKPGAFPYRPDYQVWDYILLSGGIDENKGRLSGIYIVDEGGNRTKVEAGKIPEPGDVIYVDKKALFKSDQSMQNFFIITGWVSTLVALATAIMELVALFIP